MKFNSINTVYFSPTNGTKRIIEEIVSNLNINEVITSDITDYDKRKYNINVNEDLAIIGVPVYYGRVEKTAAAYLKEHLNGNNTPAIIVAVYGNRHFDDALVELHDLVKDNSFNVIAAGAFIGEHSFSNEKHLIGANRPDKADINHVKLFVEDILQKIETTNDINSLTELIV